MTQRQGFRRGLVALAVVVGLAAAVSGADSPTPAESLARLKAGNATFVASPADALPVTAARRTELAKGQAPFATVLSCSDSRVPPEIVFHTGLGDLFVVRAAGHVPDRSVLASAEYAAEHLNSPLLVVMGHESCGAVKAASEALPGQSLGPNLDYLIKAIQPSVARASSQSDATRLRAAILGNVEETINDIMKDSAILRHLAESRRIALVGAYYELSTGRVHFSDMVEVPKTAPESNHTH